MLQIRTALANSDQSPHDIVRRARAREATGALSCAMGTFLLRVVAYMLTEGLYAVELPGGGRGEAMRSSKSATRRDSEDD